MRGRGTRSSALLVQGSKITNVGAKNRVQAYDFSQTCSQCTGKLVDAGDELVCQACGVVKVKEVVEVPRSRALVAIDFTGQALGGYMGSIEVSRRDRRSKGLSASHTSYDYLKQISDYAGREDSAVYTCAKLIERVSERLSLPKVVMSQAVLFAKRLLACKVSGPRITLATISAYSMIAACKLAGVASVSLNDVVEAHRAMGRKVTSSSLIQLTLQSPVKTAPRHPQDYIPRVLAKLSMDESLTCELEREGVNKVVYLNTLRQTAKEILESVDENSKAGRRPCALAATAVYAAESLLSTAESRRRRVTQRQVAEYGDTAEYTVREQYRGIFMPSRPRVSLVDPRPLPPPRSR